MRVIDFFCGCGGASKGFELAGFNVALGIDFDENTASSYRANFPNTKFIQDDIRNVRVKGVAKMVPDWKSSEFVSCACAPCQPFSSTHYLSLKADTVVGGLTFTRSFFYHQLESLINVTDKLRSSALTCSLKSAFKHTFVFFFD
ncbi:C-5 cytosine-specific DNA methylase family protein [Yersinia rohdei]|uniref:DNA (cytosine-5-)-methyltransferase n=1 Tax=Yersinia rohdei TaxID=29485 RepID=A0ABM5SCG3_YERRO|nr:DNA cytosine methyltransferase [Yersinia rohdei]AJJ10935.1 C-5 cytosine-specific DNA methylase family protein [Yersinia rohdei]